MPWSRTRRVVRGIADHWPMVWSSVMNTRMFGGCATDASVAGAAGFGLFARSRTNAAAPSETTTITVAAAIAGHRRRCALTCDIGALRSTASSRGQQHRLRSSDPRGVDDDVVEQHVVGARRLVVADLHPSDWVRSERLITAERVEPGAVEPDLREPARSRAHMDLQAVPRAERRRDRTQTRPGDLVPEAKRAASRSVEGEDRGAGAGPELADRHVVRALAGHLEVEAVEDLGLGCGELRIGV